ncbi:MULTISPECIES: lysophospholipid acyltransferase family protein [unclassified Halomonas]|uniref:lysophospholipid acyltransferase family protein n=1 Tax=unclassified Halomonas TaxID=2609666 RepID=UPI0021E513CF|nr:MULTISPECIES: 1-acyl-sn-glycerol-3-phosphate acyltransferase [unclassified Halomonas]UYG00097.1 1-acyl-sn-glycerol-3-phosphate acyltransferase [Halomonas sp. GD1P12]WNL38814.1 1-acyl-sn-glycerol-3-phosphate acyltransferase [Halomonas sp. PAMB 3232]WNL42153.1 1-acyl-sn-glycerol-3-phosphate acyltransferase [Halomonas sp. PAMB 3264]
MTNVLRSLVFYLGYFTVMLACGVLFLPLTPFLPLAWRYRLLNLYNYFVIFWFQCVCDVRYDIQGREHIPDGPCVIQANHQSEWETVFLQVMKPPVCTVLKQELLRIPIFGWALRLLRPIGLDRSKPARAMKQVLTQGVARLQGGLSVLIFPEGTRVDPGRRKRYNKSGTVVACRAGVPVLPVAHNAGERWPGRHWVKQPGELRVRIGEPIETAGRTPDEVLAEVERWIESTLEEISDVPRGDPVAMSVAPRAR